MTRNDNTGRTYWLVQQTADAIRVNTRGSKTRVRRLLRLIDKSFWEQELPQNSLNRLSQRFVQWRENSREFDLELRQYHGGAGAERGRKSFTSPYLQCNFANTSFRLVLPSQLVKLGYAAGVSWRITCGESLRCFETALSQGVIGYKTEQMSLPIPADTLFDELDIELRCSGTRLRRFKIGNDCIRFFDRQGDYVQPESLSAGDAYAFTRFGDIPVSEASVETERRGNLSLTYFQFQHGDILRMPDGKPLSIGRKLEEGVLPRGRVIGAYALNSEGVQVPIYNRPPTILAKLQSSRAAGTLIRVNDRLSRFFDEATVIIDLQDRSGETGYLMSIGAYGCLDDGMYQVMIDVPGDRTNRFWQFALVSGFRYEFEDAPYVFVPRGTIRFPEGLGVESDERSEKLLGENAFKFQIDAQSDDLMFIVKSAGAVLPVRVYAPVFKWKFDQGEWQIGQPSEIWHSEFPRMIYLKHPEDHVTLSLDEAADDASGEQKMRFPKRKEKHLFECDMARFHSWFGRDRTLRLLYLDFPGHRREFLRVVTKSIALSCVISADYEKGTFMCELDIIGKSNYYVDVSRDGQVIVEKVAIVNGKLELPMTLASGQYGVAVFEEEGDDTGFGDTVFLPVREFRQDLLNPHDLRGRSILLSYVKSDEASIFHMPFGQRYVVMRLMMNDSADPHTYHGLLHARDGRGRNPVTMNVRVEFHDLNKLTQTRIAFLDDDEYREFLYDVKLQAIVREDDMRLPRAERYRRYTPLYTDEYTFVVSFLESAEQSTGLAKSGD